MAEKKGSTPMYLKMNRAEFLYNKKTLRTVNDKLRENSGDRSSRAQEAPNTPPASHA